MTFKILTLSDGFGDTTASPAWYPDYYKWPFILGLMTEKTEIINLSKYSAGNEYITNALRSNYKQADAVFVMWPTASRLDLMLTHENPIIKSQWEDIIKNDPVYHDNIKIIDETKWWLSGGSKQSSVLEYHERFISRPQHQLRAQIWMEYCHQLLQEKMHGFMLTYELSYIKNLNVPEDTWIWHEPFKGITDWRLKSRFRDLDLKINQPIPLIQFDFIKQFIMPKFDLPWRTDPEVDAIESMLLKKHNFFKDNSPT